jgi:hypothetical protein
MSSMKQLSSIRLNVTGARGPVGINLIGNPSNGQFLTKLSSGSRDFAGASSLPAGSLIDAITTDSDKAPSGRAVGSGLVTKADLASTNSFVGPFALTSLGSISPANGIYLGVGGNSLSFATLLSNPAGGADADNQRATHLIAATTSDDGNSEEQTLCVLTTIQTGFSKTWAVSTTFSVGDNTRTNGNTYRCTTAGTSAATGAGPSGKSSSITDGSVVWKWINDGATDAKVGIYNETLVLPGAGSSWGQANNLQVSSGVIAQFIVQTELDLTNNCGTDSTIGGFDKYNLYIANQGDNKSTSAIEVGSANSLNFSAIWGAHFSGIKLASNSVIGIDASSAVGIGFGIGAGGAVNPTFTDSVIKDGGSTAPNGIVLAGSYSSEAIAVTGATPAAYVAGGSKTTAAFWDLSTTPIGLKLNGTYSQTPLQYATLPANYSNDAAAAAGGVPVGGTYRNGSVLMVRVS